MEQSAVTAQRERLLEEIAEIEGREQEYQGENRIEFFDPFYYQEKTLGHLRAGKKTITLQGANQIGKTVLGANVTGSGCLGVQPWDGKETIWGRQPIKVRIICRDFEKHADTVIVPELKTWLPKGRYITEKNNVGTEAFWTFPDTGSTIEIMTHKQDTESHEGWKGHLVWADEPIPRDKYVANKRGLVAHEGVFLLTMTAVKESWILDEVVRNPDPSFASVTSVPMRDNPTLTEKAIKEYRASLREDEIMARIDGGWLNLAGLVWKGFVPDTHIIDDFNVPTDYPVVPFIDFHPVIPQALSFYAWDQSNQVYVIDEIWEHMSAEETADHIIRAKKTKAWRISEAFIDPLSKGDTANIKQRGVEVEDSFSVIQKRLWPHGIDLQVASKDKNSGILNVEKMLSGVNSRPTLFFLRGIVNKYNNAGHIWEIQRWNYDDNEKPKDENDHFMENLYRMTLTGTRYTSPRPSGEDVKSETEFRVFG